MGTILGDMFKKVGGGLGKVFDGDVIDGVGDFLGGMGDAAERAIGGVVGLFDSYEEQTTPTRTKRNKKGKTQPTGPKRARKKTARKSRRDEISPVVKAMLFEVAVLAKMAKSDGRVDKSEISFVNSKFEEWGLDAEAKETFKAFFNDQKKDVSDVLQCACAAAHFAAEASPDDEGLEIRIGIYRDLFLMAVADGDLDENEVALLQVLPDALQLGDDAFELMARALFGNDEADTEEDSGDTALADAYSTLGVSPDASDAEVRNAWKKKMAAFHPDKIQGKDLDPEWLELANQQSAKINAAYETIKAARKG